MRFTIFQDSKVGDREGNEDRVGYSYSRDVLLMVIADGMGGHQQGEVAAEIAVHRDHPALPAGGAQQAEASPSTSSSPRSSRRTAPSSRTPIEHNLLECPRTTCVACVIQNGYAYWAHAGDSRLYVLRRGQPRRRHPGPLEGPADDRRGPDHAGAGRAPPRPQQDLQLPRAAWCRRTSTWAARSGSSPATRCCCPPTASGRRFPRPSSRSMLTQADRDRAHARACSSRRSAARRASRTTSRSSR